MVIEYWIDNCWLFLLELVEESTPQGLINQKFWTRHLIGQKFRTRPLIGQKFRTRPLIGAMDYYLNARWLADSLWEADLVGEFAEGPLHTARYSAYSLRDKTINHTRISSQVKLTLYK